MPLTIQFNDQQKLAPFSSLSVTDIFGFGSIPTIIYMKITPLISGDNAISLTDTTTRTIQPTDNVVLYSGTLVLDET